MFLKLKTHKRMTPAMNAMRDVQLRKLVSQVNQRGKESRGARPSVFAESSSRRFSRMAD